jgi:hypothetical protein
VRRYGHWVRLDARKLRVGRYLFARHGRKIVFFGRLITALRTYAAFFAGLNAIRGARRSRLPGSAADLTRLTQYRPIRDPARTGHPDVAYGHDA